VIFRKLESADWQSYKAIRLQSLEQNPQAFESSLVEETFFSPEQWQTRLIQNQGAFCLGAFTDQGELVAIACFNQGQKLKTRHKSYLWGVYVLPQVRGQSLAKQLIETLIHEFNQRFDISILQLTVTSNNVHAITLYQKLGFKEYGIERDAIRVEGQSFDEILMSLVKPELGLI